MATTIGTLLIDLKTDTTQLIQGMHRAEQTVKRTTQGMTNAVKIFAGAYASLSAIDLSKSYIKQVDSLTSLNNKLKLVTDSTQELNTVQNQLFAISQRTHTSLSASADLYSKMADSMFSLGKSPKDILRTVETVQKAIAISGSTIEGAAASVMQLGQAFGSNNLAGDELKSILENAKGLAQAIADGMGVPIGKLKELGAAGQINAEILAKALERVANDVDGKYKKMDLTIGMSFTNMQNSIQKIIGEFDKYNNISKTISDTTKAFSKYLDDVSPEDLTATVKDLTNAILVFGGSFVAFKAGKEAFDLYGKSMDFLNKRTEAAIALEKAKTEAINAGAQAQNARNAYEQARIADLKVSDDMLAKQTASIEKQKIAQLDLVNAQNALNTAKNNGIIASKDYQVLVNNVSVAENNLAKVTSEVDNNLKKQISTNNTHIQSLGKTAVALEENAKKANAYAYEMQNVNKGFSLASVGVNTFKAALSAVPFALVMTGLSLLITKLFETGDAAEKVANAVKLTSSELANLSDTQLRAKVALLTDTLGEARKAYGEAVNAVSLAGGWNGTDTKTLELKVKAEEAKKNLDDQQKQIKDINLLLEKNSILTKTKSKVIPYDMTEAQKVFDKYSDTARKSYADINEDFQKIFNDMTSKKADTTAVVKNWTAAIAKADTDFNKKQSGSLISNFKEKLDEQLKGYKDELDITSKDLALNLEAYQAQGLISSEALEYGKEYVKIQDEILIKEKELQALQSNQGKNPEATAIKIQEAIKNIDLLQKELQSSMSKYSAKVNEEFNKSFADFSSSFDALAKKQEETILKTSSALIDNDPLAALALEHKFTIQKIADDTQATYQQAADKMNEALLKASVLTDKDEIARAYKQINDESTIVFAKINKAQKLLIEQAEKDTKDKADKIRFAWLDDITSAINKGLDASIFDALTGKFTSFKNWWSNFWSSMGQAALQGLSRYLSGGLTDLVSSSLKSAMGGNGSPSLFKSFGIAGMSIPAFANASEATSWLQSNSGGLAASDVAAMQNSINSGNFSSSDLKSLVSTASNLKSVYEMMSGGLSSAVFTPFSYAAQGLGSLGYTNAAFGVGQLGYGFANPIAASYASTGTFGLTGAGAMLGGAALDGIGGYALGSIGDSLFGTKTNAGTYGAIGGALGGAIGSVVPVVGTAIGAAVGAGLGSVLGGAFGTGGKQTTSQGVIIEDSVKQGITNAFTYQNWNKAGGWFGGGSSGQERQGIDSATLNSLVKAQTTFQSVLEQLNINTKLTAGGSFQSFGDYANLGLSTNFLSILSGQDATQSGIYQQWKNYAESINKSVSEAILTSFGSLKTLNRQIDVFNANLSGGNSLSLSLQYANEDLQTLKDSFNANNVTLANFRELMDASIKASPTPDNITNWNSLATALQTAATAQKAYQDALDNQNKSLKAVLVSFGRLSDTTQIDASLALGIANTKDAYLSFVQNAYNSTILLTDKQKEAISSLSQAYAAQEQTAKAYISSIISLVSNLKNIATSFIDSFSTSTLSTREQIVQYNKLRAQFESFFTSTGELSSSISNEQAQSVYTQLSNLGKTLGQNNNDLVSSLMSQFQNDLSRLDLTSEVINVRIVDGLGQLYSLSAEQIKQLKLLTDDGSVTINELNTISGLTDLQKNNILSAINSTGLSSLSSFDVGTPNIPYDQLAKVHKNEMIVPESFASAIRSGDLTLSGRAPNISSFNPLSNIVDTLSGFIKDIGDYPKKTFDILDDVINGRSTVRVGVVP